MKLVALDIESAGLSAKSDPNTPIWCVGFAWDDRSYTLRFDEAKEHINELLKQEDTIFLQHNAAFDIAALRCHGVNIPSGSYICTRLMAYCSNTQEQNGLDILSRKYLGDNKAPIKDELVNEGVIGKSDDHWSIDYGNNELAYAILAEYCKHDAELCLKLYYWLWERRYKSDEKLQRSFFWTELPYVECIIDMEATGMYINTSLLDELTSLITDELTNINERINNVVGLLPEKVTWNNEFKTYIPVDKTYNNGVNKNKRNAETYYSTGVDGCYSSSSPSLVYNHTPVTTLNPEASHFTWFLMERLGWKPERLSKKTGEPTTDKQVMNELENEYPVVVDIKRRRELEKLQGSFIGKLKDVASSGELPFVRCDYNQCKTITTRLSSSSPNLQNVPSRSKLGKRIRDAVIAPSGYDLWVADLDAIELRVLAFYLKLVVGEDRMWSEFQKPDADPHTANQIAWGLPNRSDAKKIFAVIYGGGAAAVGAYGNGGTPEQGQVILDAMKSGMPAIWELMETVWYTARKRDGLLYTWFGNPIWYPDLNSKDKWKRARAERQAFNCLIQGTAAGVNKELGTQVNSEVIRPLNGRLAFSVHDENGCYIPMENGEEFSTRANIIYNNRMLLSSTDKKGVAFCIPVTGTWAKGENWNIAKAGG